MERVKRLLATDLRPGLRVWPDFNRRDVSNGLDLGTVIREQGQLLVHWDSDGQIDEIQADRVLIGGERVHLVWAGENA